MSLFTKSDHAYLFSLTALDRSAVIEEAAEARVRVFNDASANHYQHPFSERMNTMIQEIIALDFGARIRSEGEERGLAAWITDLQLHEHHRRRRKRVLP